ncbi:MAG: hypothetical protein HY901_15980 [Deltaproteobacteria bacterium]|nr:hypothetical protein [Deltaproteobacteria bacterium]
MRAKTIPHDSQSHATALPEVQVAMPFDRDGSTSSVAHHLAGDSPEPTALPQLLEASSRRRSRLVDLHRRALARVAELVEQVELSLERS